MVDNPAIHELNNIEVRGGDTDFQVVNIGGTSEDILLEYNDATEEWDIRGTVSDLDVADLEYEFGLHQTEINEDKEIPEGQGSVIAGPLTGEGEITGEGNLAVVDDVQDAVRNPVQENVDFNSNDATGISALEADKADTRSGYTSVVSSRSFDTTEINTTGSDLDVVVTVQSTADGTDVNIALDVDGLRISNLTQEHDSVKRVVIDATVPNGSEYELRAFGDSEDYEIDRWVEQS